MPRRFRGTSIAIGAALLVIATSLLAACDTARPSPSARATPVVPPSPVATSGATPGIPTPVPTAIVTAAPTQPEAPLSSLPPRAGELVLRMTVCSDTCGPNPGTTILDDGRIVFLDDFSQVLESRLTKAGLEKVRAAIAAVEALRRDADYTAELRPGAEPSPHGVGAMWFTVGAGKGAVHVSTVDADSFAAEAELWTIPKEARELTKFARLVADPVAWLGPDAFDELIRPYIPAGYLVRTEALPGIGLEDEQVELDDVAWPVPGPIEALGDPLPAEPGERPARCFLIDRATGLALLAAEAAAGVDRSVDEWNGTIIYNWARGDGWVDVSVMPLLPHQTGDCVEISQEPPA